MKMDLEYNQVAKIKVFGIGGAGCNAVNRMVEEGVQGVEDVYKRQPGRFMSGLSSVINRRPGTAAMS